MSAALVVGVGAAGGCGAVLRYSVDRAITVRTAGDFPWGTASVNVAGSLVLGVLTGLAWFHGLGAPYGVVLGTGLCGGLTTWSTASWESVRLLEAGEHGPALAHALGGLAVATAAAALGVVVAWV